MPIHLPYLPSQKKLIRLANQRMAMMILQEFVNEYCHNGVGLVEMNTQVANVTCFLENCTT